MSYPNQPRPGQPDHRPNEPYPPPVHPQGQYPPPYPPPQAQQYPPPYPPPQAQQYPQQQPYQQSYPSPGQEGQDHGSVTRPGVVTTSAVIAFVWAVLQLAAVALLATIANLLGGTEVIVIIGAITLVFSVLLVWGGVQTLSGKNSKFLGFAALALGIINGLGLIYSVTQGGTVGFGLISVIVPMAIVTNLRQQKSRDFFAAKGGSSF